MHINYVYWQLSTQNGMQQHIPVKINSPMHQIQATPPGVFLGKLSISQSQKTGKGVQCLSYKEEGLEHC